MEKLDRKDLRFVALCVAIALAGAVVTVRFYYRVFPEASIDFRVNRGQARVLAEKFLGQRQIDVAGHRFAGRFDIEEEPKIYLERELGLEKASRYYGKAAKVWRWEMRWFRSGVKEEERVALTPLGDLAAFESVRRDEAPGPSPTQEEARDISRRFLAGRGLAADLHAIEATPVVRPRRTDWTFVDEKAGLKMGEATVRYATTVSFGQVSAFREMVHVPESWERDYRSLRSKNDTANLIGNFALILTFLAMCGVLLTKIVRHDVRWGLVAGFGLVAFSLALLSVLNGLPLTLFDYDTASSLTSFLTSRVVASVLGAVGIGAAIGLVVGSSEPIYRERFPRHLSLSGIFSRRGLRTRRFFRGLMLGYAMTAFFFAYQIVFYLVAAKLGAWAPSDVQYDNMLSTAFPWVTVLFIGFLPAVLEEGSSRIFSISFLDKLGAGRVVAVVLPAFIWGFNHAAYPNQPFYIRGLEVGLAGCAIGVVMLRAGVVPLLVWHFTVDALYTAIVLLRSGNTYYVVSGAVSSLILLLPLAICLFFYWKRKGFEPETGLTNGEEGFVAPPSPAGAVTQAEEAPAVSAVSPVPGRLLLGGVVAALAFAATFLFPSSLAEPLVRDASGRARGERLARDFLKANGVAAQDLRSVTYAATGFGDDEEAREIRPDEAGKLPGFDEADAIYVVRQGGLAAFERLSREELPLALWVTRFFRPLQKEEWKVLVDSRRSRVVAFLDPIDENAPAPAALSQERARARALEAAARLGYPSRSYSILEVGTRDRPKRRDTTLVLEDRSPGLGEARPRLTAVFHGDRLAAFYPTIRVPEAFLRDYRQESPIQPILVGVRVIAIGAFLGVGIILFIRQIRSRGLEWRRWWPALVVAGLFGIAGLGNTAPTLLRAYPTEYPLSLFRVTEIVGLALVWILVLCFAVVGFVLFSAARPGWRRALRSGGTLPDALGRSVIAAAGLAGIQHATGLFAERVPDLFVRAPALPSGLESAFAPLAVLWSAALWTFALATAAAVVTIASREAIWRKPAALGGLALLLLAALVPTSFHSAAEFFGVLAPSLLTVGWLAFSAFVLLGDHVAAWVFFGVFASGVPAALRLLSQPAAPDRVAGVLALLVLVAGAAAIVGGRRRGSQGPAPGTLPPDVEIS